MRRLTKRVGLDVLIAAMPAIVMKHPDVLLYIGGKGYLEAELQRQVAQLNLSSYVQFIGFIGR